jgi:hypothetical protein
LATFYRAREQSAEFAVLYDNLLNGCPAQQAREYFKERLYYLATQLEPDDIPASFRNFDFGPVRVSALGRLGAHTDPKNRGKMYERAIAKHRAKPTPNLATILANCSVAPSIPATGQPQPSPR